MNDRERFQAIMHYRPVDRFYVETMRKVWGKNLNLRSMGKLKSQT